MNSCKRTNGLTLVQVLHLLRRRPQNDQGKWGMISRLVTGVIGRY